MVCGMLRLDTGGRSRGGGVGNRLEGGARARVAIRKLSSEIIDFEPAEGRTP